MKQKIVMKVQMNCQKCRCKAMEIAASLEGAVNSSKNIKLRPVISRLPHGVISVAIEGKEEDQVVVVGEGVDSIDLTSLMRKKVGRTYLVKVEEVKPKDAKEPPPWYCHPYPPQFVAYEYQESSPGPSCSIM